MPSSAAMRAARHICIAASVGQLHAFRVDEVAALIDRERERDSARWTDAMMACRAVAPFGRPAVDALARHLGAIVSRCFGCGAVYRAVDPEGADCGVSDGLCSMKCGVPDDAITPLEDMQ